MDGWSRRKKKKTAALTMESRESKTEVAKRKQEKGKPASNTSIQLVF